MAHDQATKDQALELYAEHGLAHAHHHTGIPKSTIRDWAKDHRITTARADRKTERATETARRSVAERKARLASDLLDDLQQLRAQLFAPCVEKKPMTVSDGHLEGAHVEIVEVNLDRPTFAGQQKIMTTLAIGVDKVQILTGDVTERTEHVGPQRTPEQEQELAKVLHLVQPDEAVA